MRNPADIYVSPSPTTVRVWTKKRLQKFLNHFSPQKKVAWVSVFPAFTESSNNITAGLRSKAMSDAVRRSKSIYPPCPRRNRVENASCPHRKNNLVAPKLFWSL